MNNLRSLFLPVICFLVIGMAWSGVAGASTLNWIGGGGTTEFDDLSNWSGTPTGGTIDPIALVDEYVVSDGSAAITSDSRLNFIDDGVGGVGILTISAGTLSTLTAGNNGIGLLQDPDSFGVMNVTGGTVSAQFLAEINATLGGTGAITLNGAGNPINISTINFTSATSTLNMLGETVEQFETEHLSKITVNGAPAVIGANLSVVSDGGAGSIVTAIPEPSSLALLALGGLALAFYRRRS